MDFQKVGTEDALLREPRTDFNLEILLAALIALAILTFELFATWSAFERSISPIKLRVFETQ